MLAIRRIRPRRKRAARIAGGLALVLLVLFSVFSMVGIKYIYREQFRRFEEPDPATTLELSHTELSSLFDLELVSFPSGDNRLQGYLYSRPASPGLVVVAHGLGGGAQSYLPEIKYFLEQGWSVFAYDATGSYRSQGDGTRGFPQSVIDLEAALRFVRGRADLATVPVLLFGHSWGGYAVANVLHFRDDIAGLAAVAAPNSSMEIMLEQGSEMIGGAIYTQVPFIWLYERLVFGKAASFTAVDALNKTTIPALIIHGTRDSTVKFDGSGIMGHRHQITNPNVQFIVLDEEERSGHNNILRSLDSIHYTNQLNAELKALSSQYNGGIPSERKKEFFARIDKAAANEVNRELMDTIHRFFLSCL